MQGQLGRTDRALAMRQWEALRAVLARDAEVELVAAQTGLPDMVFTANAGMVRGRTAVVSRFRSAERQGEERHFSAWFESHGFRLAPWPKEIFFEARATPYSIAGER